MKQKIFLSVVSIIAVLIVGFLVTNATVSMFEGFEDYADETALDTQTGGSGWSAAWAASTSVAADTAQAQTGSVSVELRTGAVRGANRPFTSAMDNDTTFKIWFRTANSTLDAVFIYLKEGTGNRGSIGIFNDNAVYVCGTDGSGCNPGAVNIGTWAINTWYCVQIEVDATNDRYRANFGTSCSTPNGTFVNTFAAFATIDRLFLFKESTTNNVWFDQIGEPPAAGGPPATQNDDSWFLIL